MEWLTHLQWPAMVITVLSTWLVGSNSQRRRRIGFWTFLFSNVLWTIWGIYDDAPALVALQVALAFMNIRGARKAAAQEKKADSEQPKRDRAQHGHEQPVSDAGRVA